MPVTTAVRPFTIPKVPEAELQALQARIAATRWPDPETVTDDSQGVPLAMMRDLVRYWAADYDWRRCEAKLAALPQFMTEITSAVLGYTGGGHPAGDLTRDDILDNITLYWLTNNVENVMLSLQANAPIDQGAAVARTNMLGEFPYFGAPHADPIVD